MKHISWLAAFSFPALSFQWLYVCVCVCVYILFSNYWYKTFYLAIIKALWHQKLSDIFVSKTFQWYCNVSTYRYKIIPYLGSSCSVEAKCSSICHST